VQYPTNLRYCIKPWSGAREQVASTGHPVEISNLPPSSEVENFLEEQTSNYHSPQERYEFESQEVFHHCSTLSTNDKQQFMKTETKDTLPKNLNAMADSDRMKFSQHLCEITRT
jgi:hypothetical protein